jgi:hypothetical protein
MTTPTDPPPWTALQPWAQGHHATLTTPRVAPSTSGGSDYPLLEIDPPAQQRRWTIALRAVLWVPSALWWWIVGIGAVFVTIAAWFVAVVTGRIPGWVWRYLTGYQRRSARTCGYLMLLTDHYPQFGGEPNDEYPVRLLVGDQPPARLNRVAVLFRLPLAMPAIVLGNVLETGWMVAAPFAWLWVLITGRAPAAYFQASMAVLRWYLRYMAWILMLTSTYPHHLYGDRHASGGVDGQIPSTSTGTLRLSRAASVLLSVFVVLGAAYTAYDAHVQIASTWAGLTGSNSAATSTSDAAGAATAPAAPTPAQQALLNHIPVGLRSSCYPADDPGVALDQGLLASEVCPLSGDNGSPPWVTYYLYKDQASTSASYFALVAGWGNALSGPVTGCGQGTPGSGVWSYNTPPEANQMDTGLTACGAGKSAFLVWTSAATNIRAELDAADGDNNITNVAAYWNVKNMLAY